MIQVCGIKNCDSVKKALRKENLLIKRSVKYNNKILIGFHHEKYQKVFL